MIDLFCHFSANVNATYHFLIRESWLFTFFSQETQQAPGL